MKANRRYTTMEVHKVDRFCGVCRTLINTFDYESLGMSLADAEQWVVEKWFHYEMDVTRLSIVFSEEPVSGACAVCNDKETRDVFYSLVQGIKIVEHQVGEDV